MEITALDIERFMEKVQIMPGKDGKDGCWIWLGCADGHGYGSFRVGHRVMGAHRYALLATVGEPPGPGYEAAHRCQLRACVSPAHLRWATRSQNQQDAVRDRTHFQARKTTCPEGHPYDVVDAAGTRGCRRCRQAHHRAYLERRKDRLEQLSSKPKASPSGRGQKPKGKPTRKPKTTRRAQRTPA